MDIDYKKIKLVIWDLDETFWKGTISEGEVVEIPQNIKLVENLAKRGIVNSICSKNNLEEIKKEFKKDKYNNCYEYFVFNSIDWSAKGQRISKMIADMQLRDENALFVDDNLSNLNEAKYYCKNIQIITPDKLIELVNNIENIGKDDTTLTRLKQYKILEQKFISKKSASSNEEFLKSSNIIAIINNNCLDEEERLYEICIRTNQMNFTKNRVSQDELHKTLTNKDYNCGYVKVYDNFGDYGIAGFYALNKTTNELEHFLFSCRILGMGVAQSIYKYLNCPKINIKGEVTEDLDIENKKLYVTIRKSSEKDTIKNKKSNKKLKILLKGACDLGSTIQYFQGAEIDTEFPHANNDGVHTIGRESLIQTVQAHKFTDEEKENVLKLTPFMHREDFATNIYSDKYDVVVLSLIMETTKCLYKHKPNISGGGEFIVPFCFTEFPLTDKTKNSIYLSKNFNFHYGFFPTKEELDRICEEFTCIGLPTPQNVLDNLLYIRKHMNPKTKLIVILGSEIDYENTKGPGYSKCAELNKIINKLLKENMSDIPNIEFVNITDLITCQSDFTDCPNHFTRHVYFKLAQEIIKHFPNKTLTAKCSRLKLIGEIIHLQFKICSSKLKLLMSKKRKIHYWRKIKGQENDIASIKTLLKNIH